MIAHAEAQFRLASRTADGLTERDHLLAWERATGRRASELDVPQLPRGGEHLWDVYAALHGSRKRSSGAFHGIEWAEMTAFQQAYGVRLSPWELDALRAIDLAVLPILNRRKPQ